KRAKGRKGYRDKGKETGTEGPGRTTGWRLDARLRTSSLTLFPFPYVCLCPLPFALCPYLSAFFTGALDRQAGARHDDEADEGHGHERDRVQDDGTGDGLLSRRIEEARDRKDVGGMKAPHPSRRRHCHAADQ